MGFDVCLNAQLKYLYSERLQSAGTITGHQSVCLEMEIPRWTRELERYSLGFVFCSAGQSRICNVLKKSRVLSGDVEHQALKPGRSVRE